jgi:linear primary-alkylsulfatase
MTAEKKLQSKPAESLTSKANERVRNELPFSNRDDFDAASRGFIETLPGDVIIPRAKGPGNAWNLGDYSFLIASSAPTTDDTQKQIDSHPGNWHESDPADWSQAPAEVNPSLWRNAQLTLMNGLFHVKDNITQPDQKIFQVRGFDLSNMTIIETPQNSVILIDPLVSTETARAALDLYYKHRGQRRVAAVIFTHSHVDHYGGVKGVIDENNVYYKEEDIDKGVRVLAPDGFLEHAVSENVFAGNAMTRRAIYMYGALLPKGEQGQVDAGLGKYNSTGTITLIQPNDIITETGQTREIDGVMIEFQMALETEAPSEMLFYFPQFNALCAAEDMTHNLHNLYTLRGAEVRNAKAWWKVINEAIDLYGDNPEKPTDVLFASHHWPTWGNDKIVSFMKKQRDLYKFIHDQSLRLLNHGYTMIELAEMIELPKSLSNEWYNRGYYGTLNHDAKAVYQRYIGWYDGNPANLHSLRPVRAAEKYLEYMGGAEAVMARAREDFDRGEYRWVAQVMNHVVFAQPDNEDAKQLEADALEQLGYQAESGPWRNVYLVGAYELRKGVLGGYGSSASSDVLKAMTLDLYFDYLGVCLNGPDADGKSISINWNFTDTGEKYAMTLENSALTYSANKQLPKPDATLTLTRTTLNEVTGKVSPAVSLGQAFDEAIAAGDIKVDGDGAKVSELFGLMDTFSPSFNIVTP